MGLTLTMYGGSLKPNLGDIIELNFKNSNSLLLGGKIVYAMVTKLDIEYADNRLGFESEYFEHIITPNCFLPYDSYNQGLWRIIR